MPRGLLIGPYARQVTIWRLKFWFALVRDDGEGTDRYEISMQMRGKQLEARRRPVFKKGQVPTHASNFYEYLVPDDLSPFRQESVPRFPRDKLADAALTLLTSEDIAAVTQLRLGITPTIANYGTNGETTCTSNQPLLI
ncbi:hypothetical protein [Agrobacterium tumefaciens]|uniref:hypothetical protein n=1 Tax=Agrobacterium tumefaciens TaxID=358 RepID=UPI001574DD22|nr:hypothetical protein [Agrobacterium tumefaciens]NTD85470.1 hypothetical protein [Agrobacterium tumefaciens]NTD90819.1 hypothetical protein [Agrobacterium tumefaciens]NTD96384.1 hypothetical protein [Agrobacterium tumefaciens]NTE15893.1 hypothetical protein [Agrobacterium tumefaciens]NTE23118.1 hypothetical protein [Agrobacterium tumefaciens]